MNKMIHPKPPTFTNDWYLGIELTQAEVDVSEIEDIAKTKGFREQTHRHITILSEKTFVPLYEKFNDSEKRRVLKAIKNLIQEIDWSFVPQDIYYVAGNLSAEITRTVPECRESFIRIIKMPEVDKFITQLNQILESNIPFRFPHITLFTKGEGSNHAYYGIPINSKEEFAKLHTEKMFKH